MAGADGKGKLIWIINGRPSANYEGEMKGAITTVRARKSGRPGRAMTANGRTIALKDTAAIGRRTVTFALAFGPMAVWPAVCIPSAFPKATRRQRG